MHPAIPQPPSAPARRRGLSTVEILVVIAIAGALMAIVFTVFGKVRALVQSWS